jgi:uncharacterized NAD(P)/FAD-binding protein YdhS
MSEPVAASFDFVVVGDGPSAAIVLLKLLEVEKSRKICLVTRGDFFGLGSAFGCESSEWLLNVPASKMSLYADQPMHFCKWLEESGIEQQPHFFISRKIYGSYIQDEIRSRLLSSNRHSVTFHKSDVSGVERERFKWNLNLHDGLKLSSSNLILATGLEARQITGPFLPAVWKERLPEICGRSVAILGSGLSAVDVVTSVLNESPKTQIDVFSRHGLWPKAHVETVTNFKTYDFDVLKLQSLRLRQLFHELRLTLERESENWQSILDSIRPFTSDLWNNLSHSDKLLFERHIASYWNIFRHRVAASKLNFLNEKQHQGLLQIRAARIVRWFPNSAGKCSLVIRQRGASEEQELEFDQIFNCLGPQFKLKDQKGLIKTLIESGSVFSDELGLGIKADKYGRCLTVQSKIIQGLYAIGPLIRGLWLETTAISDIRDQVNRLAHVEKWL